MKTKNLLVMLAFAAILIGASIFALRNQEQVQSWLWPTKPQPSEKTEKIEKTVPVEVPPVQQPIESPPVESQPPVIEPLPPSETTLQPIIVNPRRKQKRKTHSNVDVAGWSLSLSCEQIRWAVVSFSKENLDKLVRERVITTEQRQQVELCLARK
jgi:hypothetical protein